MGELWHLRKTLSPLREGNRSPARQRRRQRGDLIVCRDRSRRRNVKTFTVVGLHKNQYQITFNVHQILSHKQFFILHNSTAKNITSPIVEGVSQPSSVIRVPGGENAHLKMQETFDYRFRDHRTETIHVTKRIQPRN